MITEELTTGKGTDIQDQERTLEIVAAEIRGYTWSMLTNIIEIGRRLVEAKKMLPHGEFMNWCSENFGYSKSQTNNFMRLYEAYGSEQNSLFGAELNRQTFGTLNYSKALALLALPSAEERETFIEENNVEEMTTRELQQAIREKQELEKKLKESEEQFEASEKLRAETADKLFAKNADIEAANKRIRELESRPVEVAVETVRDEEAIAAAAKEAREKAEAEAQKEKKNLEKTVNDLNAKLIKAEKDLNKAENERAEAQKKADAAEQGNDAKIAEAKKETERIRAELAEAQKQLKTSAADVTAFGIHFSQIQKEWSAMITELDRVEHRDQETGEKLHTAVRELLKTFGEQAGEK